MANYTINYKCGHTEVVQLFGKEIDRLRKIKWMESGNCLNCCAADAGAKNAKIGLPTLIGTDKQIKWAEQIRANKIVDIDNLYNKFKTAYAKYDPAINHRLMDVIDGVYNRLKQQKNAIWWIDNRNAVINFDKEITETEKNELREIRDILISRQK